MNPQSPPRFPVAMISDLVFIPVKGSQVAGLAGGWLAIALSMAAIGSVAVGRVGVSSSEAQVQITVTKSVRAGIPSAISQAAEVPVSVAAVPSVTAPDPGLR